MDFFAQRRQQLTRNLKKDSGLDAILVTNPVNVTYLTGFTGDSSFVLATAKSFMFISDSRFEQQIKEEAPGIDAHIRGADQTTLEAAGTVLNKSGFKNIAVESEHLTIAAKETLEAAATKVTLANVAGTVEKMRACKDPAELNHIKAAIRIAEKAFITLVSMIRENDSERELVNALENIMRHGGANGSAFPPIIAMGERGALPHAPPTDRKVGDGSKVLIDWGADCTYKCDLTRVLTSPFGVSPTRRNKSERAGYNFDEVYAAVQQAQQAAVAAIKPGALGKDVDAAARKVLSSTKLKDNPGVKLSEYFTHGTGHGLGLEIHEFPRLRPHSTDVLEQGMVVTIEPGVYFPDWGGIRLEDDYLVTKDGAMKLTTLPHEPGLIR
jgi:Xaa-Pro aminopeptidase